MRKEYLFTKKRQGSHKWWKWWWRGYLLFNLSTDDVYINPRWNVFDSFAKLLLAFLPDSTTLLLLHLLLLPKPVSRIENLLWWKCENVTDMTFTKRMESCCRESGGEVKLIFIIKAHSVAKNGCSSRHAIFSHLLIVFWVTFLIVIDPTFGSNLFR